MYVCNNKTLWPPKLVAVDKTEKAIQLLLLVRQVLTSSPLNR